MKTSRGSLQWTLVKVRSLGALALLAVILPALWYNRDGFVRLWSPDSPPSPSSLSSPKLSSEPNRMALGPAALIAGPVSLPVAAPLELDGLSRGQIMDLRIEAVGRHPSFLQTPYRPSSAVFGQIEDGRPWWGLAGRFYFGRGEGSIEGASIHSVNVLNPFLLVGADFWHDGEIRWDPARVTSDTVMASDFPFLPRIASLVILPSEARGSVTYELSRFLEARAPLYDPGTPWLETRVDLDAYNARDMGFAYLHVSLGESENVVLHRDRPAPARIPQYLHRGGSCGYPGGCNNVSPSFPAAGGLKVANLPARIVVRLWRDKPSSAGSPPDMLFWVNLI